MTCGGGKLRQLPDSADAQLVETAVGVRPEGVYVRQDAGMPGEQWPGFCMKLAYTCRPVDEQVPRTVQLREDPVPRAAWLPRRARAVRRRGLWLQRR